MIIYFDLKSPPLFPMFGGGVVIFLLRYKKILGRCILDIKLALIFNKIACGGQQVV